METRVSVAHPDAHLEQLEVHGKGENDTGNPEEQPEANTDEDIDKELLAGPLTVETCVTQQCRSEERRKREEHKTKRNEKKKIMTGQPTPSQKSSSFRLQTLPTYP